MNKKGFTLIELLAVIVLISIIYSIATVLVKNVLVDSKNQLTDFQKKDIEKAAEQYYIREGINKNIECVNVSELLYKEYINESDTENPSDEEKMLLGSVKIIEEANGTFSYEYQDKECE